MFQDQVVWITGGGSGIGRALCHEFARQGAKLAISGRREERLQKVVAELAELGTEGLAVACDVTDDEAVKQAVAGIEKHYGRLDVMVANAGMGVGGMVEDLSDAEWRRQFDVNVFGVVNCVRHSLPLLRRSKGRLALIGSVAGMVSGGGTVPYCASKFAVRAIGLGLSQELHGSGVSCTTVAPGFVESEIGQVDNEGRFHEEWEDRRPQKLMWPSDKAARVVVRAIQRRKREFVFTWHGRFAGFLGRHAPGVVHHVASRMAQGDAGNQIAGDKHAQAGS